MANYSEEQCSNWLKENCFVNVRKEWLGACIQFLKQEHRVCLILAFLSHFDVEDLCELRG